MGSSEAQSSSNRVCELRNPVQGGDPVCQVLQEKAMYGLAFLFLAAPYCAGNGVPEVVLSCPVLGDGLTEAFERGRWHPTNRRRSGLGASYILLLHCQQLHGLRASSGTPSGNSF